MIKKLKGKLEQFVRLLFVNSVTQLNDSIVLVEYPKSGGTWLGQLISSYLEIPFPRNKFPKLEKSLYHGHYLPEKNILNNKKIILLVRDGRDVMVSQYHHRLLWNDKNKLIPKDVHYYRSILEYDDFNDVKKNMSHFINFSFTHTPSKMQQYTYMGNWASFNEAWLKELNKRNNIYLIRYESLLENPYDTLAQMFSSFFGFEKINKQKLTTIIAKYSFENQTKRKAGEENVKSFLRKGIKGDWKNYFGEKEKEIFKKHANHMLIKLGYEDNTNW
ncbi:sulfotransferase domain-containing protein [Jejudonia soesokkakensis]|uniref:Sulfotransferase domain-containing protein n=1 Tax=Jejudonia soesokkakensis TaxID=1323432 RepID=A0ABW2MP55_9FLAO